MCKKFGAQRVWPHCSVRVPARACNVSGPLMADVQPVLSGVGHRHIGQRWIGWSMYLSTADAALQAFGHLVDCQAQPTSLDNYVKAEYTLSQACWLLQLRTCVEILSLFILVVRPPDASARFKILSKTGDGKTIEEGTLEGSRHGIYFACLCQHGANVLLVPAKLASVVPWLCSHSLLLRTCVPLVAGAASSSSVQPWRSFFLIRTSTRIEHFLSLSPYRMMPALPPTTLSSKHLRM